MPRWLTIALSCVFLLISADLTAHEVNPQDIQALRGQTGATSLALAVFLGAKHMVTGVDHVLFLIGVMFLLSKRSEILWFATLFALGHTITLLAGALFGFGLNHYVTDFVIGFSVVYKGLDNLRSLDGKPPLTAAKPTVFVFGLIHGLGLASRVDAMSIPSDNIVLTVLSFNVGVELGQIVALTAVLLALWQWQKATYFKRHAAIANTLLVTAGFILMIYQAVGFWLSY